MSDDAISDDFDLCRDNYGDRTARRLYQLLKDRQVYPCDPPRASTPPPLLPSGCSLEDFQQRRYNKWFEWWERVVPMLEQCARQARQWGLKADDEFASHPPTGADAPRTFSQWCDARIDTVRAVASRAEIEKKRTELIRTLAYPPELWFICRECRYLTELLAWAEKASGGYDPTWGSIPRTIADPEKVANHIRIAAAPVIATGWDWTINCEAFSDFINSDRLVEPGLGQADGGLTPWTRFAHVLLERANLEIRLHSAGDLNFRPPEAVTPPGRRRLPPEIVTAAVEFYQRTSSAALRLEAFCYPRGLRQSRECYPTSEACARASMDGKYGQVRSEVEKAIHVLIGAAESYRTPGKNCLLEWSPHRSLTDFHARAKDVVAKIRTRAEADRATAPMIPPPAAPPPPPPKPAPQWTLPFTGGEGAVLSVRVVNDTPLDV